MFPVFRTTASLFGGTLKNCLIDMALRPITNVGNPQSPQDSATKFYVDTLVPTYTIDLQADTKVYITNRKYGAFLVTVSSMDTGGPCAVYAVSRSTADDSLTITRGNRISSSRAVTGEFVEIEWTSEGDLYLYKTGLGANGTFLVKLI